MKMRAAGNVLLHGTPPASLTDAAIHANDRSVDPTKATTTVLCAGDRGMLLVLLEHHLPKPDGNVWLAYPKGNVTDINRDSITELLRSRSWRPVSQIALDPAWSALRIRPLHDHERIPV